MGARDGNERHFRFDAISDFQHHPGELQQRAAWTNATPNRPADVFPTSTQAVTIAVSPFNNQAAYLGLSGYTALTGTNHILVTTNFGSSRSIAHGNPNIDTPPPSVVSITSPANDAIVSGSVSIVVVVEEPLVSWVNLVIDRNCVISSPPYTFTWNTTTVANGQHTIEVDAKNSSGDLLASAIITVTVVNGGPTLTLTPTVSPTPTFSPTATPPS